MVTLDKFISTFAKGVEVVGFDETQSAVYVTMYKTRRGDHRYFVKRNGDLVIADNSADWPEDTDDGELFPRLDLPIQVSIRSDEAACEFEQNVRMQCSRPNKEDCWVTITIPDMLFLSATFNVGIQWRDKTYRVTEVTLEHAWVDTAQGRVCPQCGANMSQGDDSRASMPCPGARNA